MREFWDVIVGYFTTGNFIGRIRAIVWGLIILMMVIYWIRARRRSHKISSEEDEKLIEQIYEKNEDGLYPWEVDTDISADNIKEGATPMNLDGLPKRGKWN